jgi:CMP-N-acetylneuraminic acid synthetase
MKNLAIIPARSGSKGVPGKNLKPLGGAPLLWWTLEAAMLAGEADFNLSNFPATVDDKQVSFKPVFDTVLVTSESEEILESTRKWEAGHNVQGLARLCVQLRHDKLAMDHVQTDEVLLDALRHLEYLGEGDFDNICLLQPTSPFRTYQHIYESWLFYENLRTNPVKEINCLISGTEVVSHLDGYHWFGNDEMSMVVEPMGHNGRTRCRPSSTKRTELSTGLTPNSFPCDDFTGCHHSEFTRWTTSLLLTSIQWMTGIRRMKELLDGIRG